MIYTTITDPTIWQPDFNLPRQSWSLLNRFQTDQGPCRATLQKWYLAESPTRDCGQQQTMSHIVNVCPFTKFDGRLQLLHKAEDAVTWLESTATTSSSSCSRSRRGPLRHSCVMATKNG